MLVDLAVVVEGALEVDLWGWSLRERKEKKMPLRGSFGVDGDEEIEGREADLFGVMSLWGRE